MEYNWVCASSSLSGAEGREGGGETRKPTISGQKDREPEQTCGDEKEGSEAREIATVGF